jgi:hypothetical protein
MAYFRNVVFNGTEICGICNCRVVSKTWGVALCDYKLTPRYRMRDVFFHEGCFSRSVEAMVDLRADDVRKHLASKESNGPK